MLQLLAELAREYRIGLFRRYAIMRRWHEFDGLPFSAFIIDDELHMNDWSYAALARLLAQALADAVALTAAARSAP
jgi:hypothetical protein